MASPGIRNWSTGYVCSKCLEVDPCLIDLLTHKCFAERGEHSGVPRVQVQWTERRQLEHIQSSLSAGIRPMPRVSIPGKFMLCDRKRCKGESCTFAHSTEERNAWNRQKNSGHSTCEYSCMHDCTRNQVNFGSFHYYF